MAAGDGGVVGRTRLCYRSEYRIERICHRLKSQVQIAPLFVKLNEPIEDLTSLLALGVHVSIVTAFVLRRLQYHWRLLLATKDIFYDIMPIFSSLVWRYAVWYTLIHATFCPWLAYLSLETLPISMPTSEQVVVVADVPSRSLYAPSL